MHEAAYAPAPVAIRYRGPGLVRMLPSLLVSAAAPLVIYQVLSSRGLGVLASLSGAALVPAVGTLVGWVRTRRLDTLSLVSLVFIAVGMASSLISGDPRFLLLKESFITGLVGLACFGSLLLPRPALFYIGRQFSIMGDPAAAARFDTGWERPQFRYVIRLMTVVWGSGYLAEALLRVALQMVLPISVYLAVSQVLVLAVTALLIAWTLRYANRAYRKAGQAAGHLEQK